MRVIEHQLFDRDWFTVRCPNCGCLFNFTQDDKTFIDGETFIKCPECERMIRLPLTEESLIAVNLIEIWDMLREFKVEKP